MSRFERKRRVSHGSSGEIVELLRKREMTIDELASELGVTRTAVRAQLARHLRDGLVEERGTRRSASKPARLYGLTADAGLLLSRAYVPILTELLHVLSRRLSRPEFDALMHEVGRGLVQSRGRPQKPLGERVASAQELLNSFGALTDVSESEGRYTILGYGCPLAAVTADHPEACRTLEAVLSELVGEPVVTACERYERKRCCFEISAAAS